MLDTTAITNEYKAAEAKRIADLHQSSSINNTKDMFMSLFLTQLKNQDPLEPLDNSAMIDQMAQINSVQELQSMNSKLESLVSNSNSFGSSAAIIGKLITGTNADDEKVYGIVDSVGVTDGVMFAQSGSDKINFSDIISVSEVNEMLNPKSISEVSGLVGKEITAVPYDKLAPDNKLRIKITDNKPITGTVGSISIDNGQIYLNIDGYRILPNKITNIT